MRILALLFPGFALAPLSAQTWNVTSVPELDAANAGLHAGDEIVVAAGTYHLDRTIQLNTASVVLRGATGNREDVVLVGGGMNTRGVDEGIAVGADDVTIRDLTVRDCYYNGIHTRAESDVDRCHIVNVKTVDIGERHIKGSRDPSATIVSDDILIDHVWMLQDMERSGHSDTNPDYIGGIDMMCVNHLTVRDCLAQGIHGSQNGGNAAIFLWNGVQDPLIERNRILGCAKGIALGNPAAPGAALATGRWHAVGGIIRNNVVHRGAWTTGNNIGIELCSTKDVHVEDNTIYSDDATYFRTISISNCEVGVGETSGLAFVGNIIRGQIKDFTDGGGWTQSGNVVDGSGATVLAAWFVDPVGGDFHLTAAATGAIGHGTPLVEVPTDIDSDTRTTPGDAGADQRSPTVTNDAAQANAYDDGWQAKWVAHCRSIYTATGKTPGFTLEVGDSITHANPYGQWPRYGAGKTASDAAICAWCRAGVAFGGTTNDTTNKNGFYLASADTNGYRGMTCSGGLDTAEFLSGAGNGGTTMPTSSDPAAARAILADGATYTQNLNVTTVAAAFSDAQIAVVMLGTNDVKSARSASDFAVNLGRIVDAFEAQRIVVVLSTIPPQPDAAADALAASYCTAIRDFARDRGLPLIDYRAEILARRGNGTWNGTLLTLNDVHPTAGVNGYTAASDPYADGGDAATRRTGAACENSGYLLRSWLTIQKLGEVKAAVVDGIDPPTGGGGATGTGTGGSSGGTTGSTGGEPHRGCGVGGAAALALALACGLRRRI